MSRPDILQLRRLSIYCWEWKPVVQVSTPSQYQTAIVTHNLFRHYRAWYPFHRPNWRWANDPDSQYCSTYPTTKYCVIFLRIPQVALQNKVTIESTLQVVRDARKKGLRAPVLFMGYYNPMLSYGEDRLLKDCQKAGVNGFIIVDLPPEEAVSFRNFCKKGG